MRYGGSHTNFNDRPLIAGGLGAGFAIGGALIQGVLNYRQQCADQRRRATLDRWSTWNDRAKSAGLDYLEGRLNAEIEKNQAQALANEALRLENERLRSRR